MAFPELNQPAPDFTLAADNGEQVSLSDFRGKKVVLFFYPRADTPGCTKEACGFRDDFSAYAERGAVVLGISPDTVNAQAKFKSKFDLPYLLLADSEHTVAEQYGTWGRKKFLGREFDGVMRTTFIIDENGHLSHIFENVKPDGHSQQVIAQL